MTVREWKEIPNFNGNYSISNDGLVRRNTKKTNAFPGKILKPWITNGYEMVGLWFDGEQTKITVHRLVAFAFVKRLRGTDEVHHRNGIKSDNRSVNLQWVSHKRNAEEAIIGGSFRRKLTRSDVLKIQRLRTARPLMNLRAIGRLFGITHGHVHQIWRNDNYADLISEEAA